MSAAGRIAALIEGLSEGNAEPQEPLQAELELLFACPQVRLPAANQKIFFDSDAKLPPCKQRAQKRGVRLSFWCCGQYVKRCNDKAGDEACPTLLEAVKQTRDVASTCSRSTALRHAWERFLRSGAAPEHMEWYPLTLVTS